MNEMNRLNWWFLIQFELIQTINEQITNKLQTINNNPIVNLDSIYRNGFQVETILQTSRFLGLERQ